MAVTRHTFDAKSVSTNDKIIKFSIENKTDLSRVLRFVLDVTVKKASKSKVETPAIPDELEDYRNLIVTLEDLATRKVTDNIDRWFIANRFTTDKLFWWGCGFEELLNMR